MMNIRTYVLSVLLTCGAPNLPAQEPSAKDPLGENLFPPELVMQFQSEIGLTDEQRDTIQGDLQKAGPRFQEMQGQIQEAVDKFVALLKKERIDEKAALAQFDIIQNLERDIKRTHLTLVIGLKNKLTPEQQAKLREVKNKIGSGQIRPPEEVQRTLEGKLQQVQDAVQRWQDAGRDPTAVAEMMQQFEPLMKQGKHKEAEALLDRALKLLRETEKDKDARPEKKRGAAAGLNSHASARSATTPEALAAEIEGLRPARLAWRGIAWKTCLLEGLQEARAQRKPLLLWIFIDRPTDDARC
jgi:Spy/CpxP family protein refolding chaperone